MGGSTDATTSDAATDSTTDAAADSADSSDGTFSSKNIVAKATKTVNSLTVKNNLGAFKSYLDSHISDLDGSVRAVETSYDVTPQVYRTKDADSADDGYVQVSPSDLTDDSTMKTWSSSTLSDMYSSMGMNTSTTSKWGQLVDDQGLRESQYELVAGDWPSGSDEVALVVSSKDQVSDWDLYTLGLLDIDDMKSLQDKVDAGQDYDDPAHSFSYSDALGREYRVFSQADFYDTSDETGDTGEPIWVDKSDDSDYVSTLYDEDRGITVHVTCVLRANDSASVSSGVAYTSGLVDALIDEASSTDVVTQQLADPSVNVLTGTAFDTSDDSSSTSSTTTQSAFVSQGAATSVATTSVGDYHPSDNALMHVGIATVRTVGEDSDSSKDTITQVGDATSQTPAATTSATTSATTTSPETSATTSVVTFVIDGATTSVTVTDGQRPTVSSDPTKDGYTFAGWKSSADGKVYASADLPKVTADVTYTATWGISDAQLAQMLSALTDKQKQSLISNLMANMTDAEKSALVSQFGGGSATDVASLTDAQKQALISSLMSNMSDSDKASLISQFGGTTDYSSQLSDYMSSYLSDYMSSLSSAEIAALMGGSSLDLSSYAGLTGMSLSSDQLSALMAQYSSSTPSTYEDVLSALGYVDRSQPSKISIYPTDFDGKQRVSDLIDEYNSQVSVDTDKVTYTDLVGTMTSSVTDIVNTISTVLIAFVSISLVVSSIMIAIITYISVLERTKEIGVLRALGASKGDVGKIFNAETVIEGLISGVLGIVVTLLLSIPINAWVESSLNVSNICQLSPENAVALIALSVALTLLAGLIPSRMAAKKDPAVALRSE
jgi:uncharacterized repeat protein (TIGR02543 family)